MKAIFLFGAAIAGRRGLNEKCGWIKCQKGYFCMDANILGAHGRCKGGAGKGCTVKSDCAFADCIDKVCK